MDAVKILKSRKLMRQGTEDRLDDLPEGVERLQADVEALVREAARSGVFQGRDWSLTVGSGEEVPPRDVLVTVTVEHRDAADRPRD